MIAAIALGIFGGLVTIIGVLLVVSACLPSFGGMRSNEGGVLVSGAAMILIGITLIFIAGTWV